MLLEFRDGQPLKFVGFNRYRFRLTISDAFESNYYKIVMSLKGMGEVYMAHGP